MAEIKIIPIFNQAVPGIWTDFAHICAATMITNYHYHMDDKEIMESINQDARRWRRGTNFAFGAYDDDKMIGFIQGRAAGRCATIQSLYVLYDYQRLHVGSRLLSRAERASALFANRTELVSLTRAEPFYQAHGYRSMYSNVYTKPITDIPRCECLPVFRCNAALANKCRKLNPAFDPSAVNSNHATMFVYFNVDGNLSGFICGNEVAVSRQHGTRIVVSTLRCNVAKVH